MNSMCYVFHKLNYIEKFVTACSFMPKTAKLPRYTYIQIQYVVRFCCFFAFLRGRVYVLASNLLAAVDILLFLDIPHFLGAFTIWLLGLYPFV